jgi:hypothetical protein
MVRKFLSATVASAVLSGSLAASVLFSAGPAAAAPVANSANLTASSTAATILSANPRNGF